MFDPTGETIDDLLYFYRGTVDRVIDGDSLGLVIDLGFKQIHGKLKEGRIVGENFRVKGINSPELEEGRKEWEENPGLPTPPGLAARNFVSSLLQEGETVLVRTHKTGKYGRFLADIYLVDSEGKVTVSFARVMLEEGHAVEYDGDKR